MKIQAILRIVEWKDRHIYYYRCKECDAVRHTCHLKRAKDRMCVKCERSQITKDQLSLI